MKTLRNNRKSDNSLIVNKNQQFEIKRYSVNPNLPLHQALEDFSNSFEIVGKNKENKMHLSIDRNIELKAAEMNHLKALKEESFDELEYHPKVPITDNDQSISVVQEYTEEKPSKKVSIKLVNAQPNLEIHNDKKRDSLKKLDYLMLESTEVFKHIDEEINHEKRRIPPHDSARVHSKLKNQNEEEINCQSTPSYVSRLHKRSGLSPDSVSPAPIAGNEINEGSHQFIKRKSRITNCKSTTTLTKVEDENSSDSIGADVDLSNVNEELPSVPIISVMNNSEAFKFAKLSKINLQWDKNKVNLSIAKSYLAGQKLMQGNINKPTKNKQLSKSQIESFHSIETYPQYLGYYFREVYRSTLKNLKENDRRNEYSGYPSEDSEDDTKLPMLTKKQIDDNKTHVTQSIQGLHYMNSIKPTEDYKSKKVTLPKTNRTKLAIFDMDETLIHCVPDRKLRSDTGSSDMKPTDVVLKFNCSSGGVEGTIDHLPVNIRPYIAECLLQVKKLYQVIVFTASKREYADTILNFIDPDHELIEYRCYRDSCITTKDGVYIKDLRIFEDQWDLKDIVLIDNAVHSFGFQINNGIPMLPFYDDKDDKDMIYIHLLKLLSIQYDVRPKIRDTFWINKLKNPKICETIEGVIEYAVEEIEENDYSPFDQPIQCSSSEQTAIRRSRSAPRSSVRVIKEETFESESEIKDSIPNGFFDLNKKHEDSPKDDMRYTTRQTCAEADITEDIDEREDDISKEIPIVSKYLMRIPNKPMDYPTVRKRDRSSPRERKLKKSNKEYEEIVVEMKEENIDDEIGFGSPESINETFLNHQLDDSDCI